MGSMLDDCNFNISSVVCPDYNPQSVLCLSCKYPDCVGCCKSAEDIVREVKIAQRIRERMNDCRKDKELYPCDPEKNTDCAKTSCYIKGGSCTETWHKEFAKDKIKVKDVTFFYNVDLLHRIIEGETDHVLLGFDFVKALRIGDKIKFIGKDTSCIVSIVSIKPKDINRNCDTQVKVVMKLKGELELEY